MPYLLALSLGPVQEFIAAARKTRDLWFGSELLSRTARAAALSLHGQQGVDLVFPAPESLRDNVYVPVPNKIVAVVDADPAALAQRARDAARAYLWEQRRHALDIARERSALHTVNKDLLNAQLADFLEFYGAWWPFEGEADYDEARQKADALLAGRKALRDFALAAGRDGKGDGIPKSLLDGGREAVIRTDRLRRDEPGLALLRRLDVKGAELLDGISLVKRLAPKRRFVSVSRIAADPLIRRLAAADRPGLDELIRRAGDLARQGSSLVQTIDPQEPGLARFGLFPFDTELFYDDGANDKEARDDEKDRGKEFYKRLRDVCKGLGISDPPPYLAILVADGDRVGATIGKLGTRERHIKFSQVGSAFARAAGDVVAKHNGALVYGGGDDVLAFLPLDTALQCAGALRATFADTMAPLGLDKETPTLSVGIAIGHFNEPLRDLLEWGRAAEQAAKRTRDTLAVALHTRAAGAADVTVAGPWTSDPLERWERWIKWYRRDALPDGAAYELRGLARAGQALQADRLVIDEAERILKRKKGGRGTRPLDGAEIEMALRRLRPDAAPEEQRRGSRGGEYPGSVGGAGERVDYRAPHRARARCGRRTAGHTPGDGRRRGGRPCTIMTVSSRPRGRCCCGRATRSSHAMAAPSPRRPARRPSRCRGPCRARPRARCAHKSAIASRSTGSKTAPTARAVSPYTVP